MSTNAQITPIPFAPTAQSGQTMATNAQASSGSFVPPAPSVNPTALVPPVALVSSVPPAPSTPSGPVHTSSAAQPGQTIQTETETEQANEKAQAEGWAKLLEYGKAADHKTLGDWKDELANLLTFTGLFSAVVTGFIVIAIPLLQEDFGEKSAKLLAQISVQLSSFRDDNQFMNSTTPPEQDIPFEPDTKAVQINILWITSLTLTLMSSFFTIAAQQWLRCIPLPPNLPIREAAALRQSRHDGLISWRVPTIISLLPVVVQISVILFLSGLLLLLDSINTTVAKVFEILGGSIIGIFGVMTFLPVLVKGCPYKTPIIPTIIAFAQLCVTIFFTLCRLIVGVILESIRMVMDRSLGGIGAIAYTPLTWMMQGFTWYSTRLGIPGLMPALDAIQHVVVDDISIRWAHFEAEMNTRCLADYGHFWLSREVDSQKRGRRDWLALCGAPVVLPKEDLAAIRPSIYLLEGIHQPRVALHWVQHLLNITSPSPLMIHSSLHAMTLTGPLSNLQSSAFLRFRDLLLPLLRGPRTWTFGGRAARSRNRELCAILCLLYRGAAHGDTFFTELGKHIFDVQQSQKPEGFFPLPPFLVRSSGLLRPLARPSNQQGLLAILPSIRHFVDRIPDLQLEYSLIRLFLIEWYPRDTALHTIPTSLLFRCCCSGLKLDRDQLISASAWASSFHTYIKGYTSTYLPPINLERITEPDEVSVVSAAIIIRAVPDDTSLLANPEVLTLLNTTADMLHARHRQLTAYILRIAALPEESHILGCNMAIEDIVRSLTNLARDAHVGRTDDCPSRRIMSGLKKVVEGARQGAFRGFRELFNEYDNHCGIVPATPQGPSSVPQGSQINSQGTQAGAASV